jgi:hypothetical protein
MTARKHAEPIDPVSMLSVYIPGPSGRTVCIGFLLLRGRQGVEAFDQNTVSLGLFPVQKTAADACYAAAPIDGCAHRG